MKNVLVIALLLVLIFHCGKKESKETVTEMSPPSPQLKKMDRDNSEAFSDEEESGGLPSSQSNVTREKRNDEGVIQKPLDPISDASKLRLLEYTIQLNYKVDDLEKARIALLNVIKKESYIANSQTNLSSGFESMSLQVQVPVSAMYETLLEMDKVGKLTYEDIRTQDWTLHNELQKIKLSREGLRMIRRSKAANKGSAETWNWKDREEALERSEDNADSAKLETWKIKDNVTWAKFHISLSGKELPTKIQLPNYKDAFISAINFLLELTYYLVFLIPILFIGFLIFKAIRWYRNR